MSTILTYSINDIKPFFSNNIGIVGENGKELISKMQGHLEFAERWVCKYFIPKEIFVALAEDKTEDYREVLSKLVVAHAVTYAIPSLDLVLTDNGFGVVNTSNVVPASKERVANLMKSVVAIRDLAIDQLISTVLQSPEGVNWQFSAIGNYFCSTLFPTLDIVDQVGGEYSNKWARYQELRSKIIEFEEFVADTWISPELMKSLRGLNVEMLRDCNVYPVDPRDRVLSMIKSQIIMFLKTGNIAKGRFFDIVNVIRKFPEEFPEWHSSETAELFAPPVFKNEKKSSGYFF